MAFLVSLPSEIQLRCSLQSRRRLENPPKYAMDMKAIKYLEYYLFLEIFQSNRFEPSNLSV